MTIYHLIGYNTTQLLSETLDPLHDRLTLLLAYGLEYVDVPRDGNCFFHALLHTLHQCTDYPWPIPETPAQLRELGVSTLRQHSHDIYEMDVLNSQLSQDYPDYPDLQSPVDSYCKKMVRDGTYADHIIITAISYLCNIKITIIQHDNTCITVSAYSNDEFLYPITIGSIRDVHFVAVREL